MPWHSQPWKIYDLLWVLTHWSLGDLNEISDNNFQGKLKAEVSCEIALGWLPLELTEDKSTLVQVMAWCRKATSYTCTNVDPYLHRHMVSLGHNELMQFFLKQNQSESGLISNNRLGKYWWRSTCLNFSSEILTLIWCPSPSYYQEFMSFYLKVSAGWITT